MGYFNSDFKQRRARGSQEEPGGARKGYFFGSPGVPWIPLGHLFGFLFALLFKLTINVAEAVKVVVAGPDVVIVVVVGP